MEFTYYGIIIRGCGIEGPFIKENLLTANYISNIDWKEIVSKDYIGPVVRKFISVWQHFPQNY